MTDEEHVNGCAIFYFKVALAMAVALMILHWMGKI